MEFIGKFNDRLLLIFLQDEGKKKPPFLFPKTFLWGIWCTAEGTSLFLSHRVIFALNLAGIRSIE